VHWLLFIHKILISSTCFEAQVLIFRRIQLYKCSTCYCHSVWEFLVACRYTAWVSLHSGKERCFTEPRPFYFSLKILPNCLPSTLYCLWCDSHVEWSKLKQTSTPCSCYLQVTTIVEFAALLFVRSRDRFPVVSLDFPVTYSFRPYHGP